jgi:uncharacterized membrane protein required for colicin V production
MNILYLVGALLLLVILGYPYFLLVIANREKGVTRIMGQVLSCLFTLMLLSSILLYVTGIAQMPKFRFMRDRPSTRMMRGMSGYITGSMIEDERAIDEFINVLKANPKLYERFKEKLKD